MITNSRWCALLLGAAAAAATMTLTAPIAGADDPSLPPAGSQSARATLNAITAKGYNPVLQYENGVPEVPLSECNVTDIDDADASNGSGNVYVTINCPK